MVSTYLIKIDQRCMSNSVDLMERMCSVPTILPKLSLKLLTKLNGVWIGGKGIVILSMGFCVRMSPDRGSEGSRKFCWDIRKSSHFS